MSRRSLPVVALVSLLVLTACGTFQHREGRSTYCRDETRCPYEAR